MRPFACPQRRLPVGLVPGHQEHLDQEAHHADGVGLGIHAHGIVLGVVGPVPAAVLVLDAHEAVGGLYAEIQPRGLLRALLLHVHVGVQYVLQAVRDHPRPEGHGLEALDRGVVAVLRRAEGRHGRAHPEFHDVQALPVGLRPAVHVAVIAIVKASLYKAVIGLSAIRFLTRS